MVINSDYIKMEQVFFVCLFNFMAALYIQIHKLTKTGFLILRAGEL